MGSHWIHTIPALLFISILIIAGLYIKQQPKQQSLQLKPVNRPLPAFTIPTSKNQPFDLQHIKRPALLNIFASWCQPCYQEHPFLVHISKQYNVPIYGINWKDTPENLTNMLHKLGNPYHLILQDTKGQLALELGVTGAPETFIVNKDGIITHKIIGVLTEQLFADEVLPLLRKE